jgi:SAM-dependent methyltransferase
MDEGITSNEVNIGEITWKRVPGQAFVPRSDYLSGVRLLLATFTRRNTCRLVLHVLRMHEGMKEEIRTVEISAGDLLDNQWHTFTFEPVPDSTGREIYFYIESPDGEEGNAFTIWASSNSDRPGYRMYLNHRPVPGGLCFGPLYSPPSRSGFLEAWSGWSRAVAETADRLDETENADLWKDTADALWDFIGCKKAVRVLEMATAQGRLAALLAPRVDEYVCVDASQQVLLPARLRLEDVSSATFSALSEREDFSEGEYDCILAPLLFLFLPRPALFHHLREMARLLAPKGRAYFAVWNLGHPRTMEQWVSETESEFLRPSPRVRPRDRTLEEVTALVKEAGLHIVAGEESSLLHIVVGKNPAKTSPRPFPQAREGFVGWASALLQVRKRWMPNRDAAFENSRRKL